jgi:hypothetical protein
MIIRRTKGRGFVSFEQRDMRVMFKRVLRHSAIRRNDMKHLFASMCSTHPDSSTLPVMNKQLCSNRFFCKPASIVVRLRSCKTLFPYSDVLASNEKHSLSRCHCHLRRRRRPLLCSPSLQADPLSTAPLQPPLQSHHPRLPHPQYRPSHPPLLP